MAMMARCSIHQTLARHGCLHSFQLQIMLRTDATAAKHLVQHRNSISCTVIAFWHQAQQGRTLWLSSCSALSCSAISAARCFAGPRSATIDLSKALSCAWTVLSIVDICRHVCSP